MEKYKVINRLTLQLLVAIIVVHKVYRVWEFLLLRNCVVPVLNCVGTVLYLALRGKCCVISKG